MLRLVLGSAAVGVIVALAITGLLRLLDFQLPSAIIGAIAGACAGIYAAGGRLRPNEPKKSK
jgi:H+/gluconate symporter-like permease